jgi:hypothetical protein
MFFLLSKFLVLSRSLSNNQKKNFCFPLAHDFHIHLKIGIINPNNMQVGFSSKEIFRTPNVTLAITFIWIDTSLMKKELKLQ